MTVLSCFNLVEAYLNGLAWDCLNEKNHQPLSGKKEKRLRDTYNTSLRDKLIHYPEDIFGLSVFKNGEDPANAFLEIVKPFRDSLVHPSPFSAPEKFGGYDKLMCLYRIDLDTAILASHLASAIVCQIHQKVVNATEDHPDWLSGLMDLLSSFEKDRCGDTDT